MWRPHGRTIPAFAGMTVTRELSVQQTSGQATGSPNLFQAKFVNPQIEFFLLTR
jgi:hypothetical protein